MGHPPWSWSGGIFWQTRFEELGKHPGFGDEVRKVALQAVETMITIEKRVVDTS
jgi:hypothetical protein